MTDNAVQVSSFATIGAVYEDGVSLIFDGEEQASDKHYRVNSSVFFRAGDRVKILPDSGTYVVEYVVGSPLQEEMIGVPAGGTKGQVLMKESAADHDAAWGNPDDALPAGGSKGQVLKKSSSTDYDAAWGNPDDALPAGGSKGQVLKKNSSTDYDAAWGDPDAALPAGGSKGQVLKKSSSIDYDATWGAPDGTLPTGGSTGQVLKKTSAANFAVAWGAPDGTLPTGGTKGQVLIKSSATNYAASWGDPPASVEIFDNNSSSYSPYYIQFKTDSSGNLYYRKGTGSWKQLALA